MGDAEERLSTAALHFLITRSQWQLILLSFTSIFRYATMASKPPDDQAERQAMSNEATPLLNISSLSRRVYDASIVRRYPVAENQLPALPSCPWKLRLLSGDGTKVESKDPYPSFTYLDLRRQQNESWATSRLEEGVQLAKASKHKEAESCYKEGLDLVPTHTQLMVAYGALCANLGRTQEAISRLERALEIDPTAANAEQYLTTIRQQQEQRDQQRQQRQGRHPNRDKTTTLALRTDNALQDAMAESVLAGDGASKPNGKYPLLADDEDGNYANDSDESKDERRRRRHKKKSKKKKRKKKRRRYDSDSSDSTSSRRRSKKRKKKHERSRDRSDSEEVPPISRRYDSS
jgi:tetratricopeptide (TPR) repeat protein